MRNDYLTKEERNEYNSAKKFARREGFGALAWVIIIVFILSGLGIGGNLLHKKYVEKAEMNIERENFESSKSYIHGMAEDLAKWKMELVTEEDEIARKAIIEMIIDRTANLDVNKLENQSIKDFVLDVQNGYYN